MGVFFGGGGLILKIVVLKIVSVLFQCPILVVYVSIYNFIIMVGVYILGHNGHSESPKNPYMVYYVSKFRNPNETYFFSFAFS